MWLSNVMFFLLRDNLLSRVTGRVTTDVVFVRQSHSYLMFGAFDANRLCLLSMGNKHMFGLDGIPADHAQAYGNYLLVTLLLLD